MTWSILARDASGLMGAAIASRFFAVGSLCLHSGPAGIIATQALINPLYAPLGIELLRKGRHAGQAITELLAPDLGREQRQVHIIGATGAPSVFTGGECIEWAGHHAEGDFSVAGNMLAGPRVIEECARAFRDAQGLPLAERLLAAMAAAEAAGGDKRGKQGAALRIQNGEDYLALDLRADDHPDPLVELRRLYDKSLERYQPYVACLSSQGNYSGIVDRQEIDVRVARFHAARAAAGGH